MSGWKRKKVGRESGGSGRLSRVGSVIRDVWTGGAAAEKAGAFASAGKQHKIINLQRVQFLESLGPVLNFCNHSKPDDPLSAAPPDPTEIYRINLSDPQHYSRRSLNFR